MDEQSFDLASDNDSEYEDYQTEATTQQLPPLVTFATSGLHSDKKRSFISAILDVEKSTETCLHVF
ncbi:unnamed protein product [Anisakis simplex]|uniref:Uncharacterized protein n=1 Tax=Anisakis simplex TaxID=6269 RepID=A0A0M3JLD7_ANISI|nr:unnamed protein product [Anisakis simplex]